MTSHAGGNSPDSTRGTRDDAPAVVQTTMHDEQTRQHPDDEMHQGLKEDLSHEQQASEGDEDSLPSTWDLSAHEPSAHCHSPHDHVVHDQYSIDSTADERSCDDHSSHHHSVSTNQIHLHPAREHPARPCPAQEHAHASLDQSTATRDFSKYKHHLNDYAPEHLSTAEKLSYYKSRARSWRSLGKEATGYLMPPATFITPTEARHMIRDLAKDIFSLWTKLNAILQNYEEIIQKRWAKKTVAQRSAILMKVRPEIHKWRRSVFKLLMNAPKTSHVPSFSPDDPNLINSFLFPHLNLDDLASKPRMLLLYLKSRGRNLPDLFALSDRKAVSVAIGLGVMSSVCLYDYTMVLRGQKSAETYGELFSWNDHAEALDWYLSNKGIVPRQGIPVMRFQKVLLDFLVQVATAVLHDTDTTSCVQVTPIREPPLPNDLSEWTNAASIAAEAAYNVPANFDFDRILHLTKARAALAHDHISNLREDPSYFANCISEWSEHSAEMVRDVDGRQHEALIQPSANKIFWDSVLRSSSREAYAYVWFWTWVTKELNGLQEMDKYLRDAHTAMSSLPDGLIPALRRLRTIVISECADLCTTVCQMAKASPAQRDRCERERHDCHNCHHEDAVDGLFYIGETFDELTALFSMLETPLPLKVFGMRDIVIQIQQLVDSNQQYKTQISPLLVSLLSDLALMTELLRQLNLYQPGHVLEDVGSSCLTELDDGLDEDIIPLRAFYKQFSSLCLGETDYMKDDRFSYPSEGKRSKLKVETMQHAERNLDDFWSRFDDHFKTDGESQSVVRPQYLVPDREIIRTKDWVEAPDSTVHRSRLHFDEEELAATVRNRLHLERTTEATIESGICGTGKAKLKTKGTADESTPVADAGAAAQPEMEKKEVAPHFKLTKRSYKVLTWFFHDPNNAEARAGDIPWAEFLHAMTKCGLAAEKLYGSIWQFTHVDTGISVQFHEPHPNSRISHHIGRRFGRRLFRNFGWTYESFERA